jgi:hypothetical protein
MERASEGRICHVMIVKRLRSQGCRQHTRVVSTTCPQCGVSQYTKNGQFYNGNRHEGVLGPSWSSKRYERHAQLGMRGVDKNPPFVDISESYPKSTYGGVEESRIFTQIRVAGKLV